EGWEAGTAYPGVERLSALITLALERGLFAPGHEAEEAAALWEIVRLRAAQRLPPFEAGSFAALRAAAAGSARGAPAPSPSPAAPVRHDWGEVPAVPVVQGRNAELATLAGWVRDVGCRVVQVFGVGGIGKTTLAVQLAHELAAEFAAVSWRSLRNAPPVE